MARSGGAVGRLGWFVHFDASTQFFQVSLSSEPVNSLARIEAKCEPVVYWSWSRAVVQNGGISNYSRVPNKRTGCLLENEKKSHLYALIRDYSFINFQQKVPPILLFTFEISHLFFMFISLFILWTYLIITMQKF